MALAAAGALIACSSDSHPAGDGGGDPDAVSADATACTDPGVTGCACAPVAAGAGGHLVPSHPVTKLVSDPTRCLLYGLAGDSILVFDTKSKTELAPIPLSAPAIDLDVDRDGSKMVVAHRLAHTVSVIDLAQRVVTSVLPLQIDPGAIEVTASGSAYYVNFDQWSSVHRLDLATGADTVVGPMIGYQMDLELSADETRLFAGDSSLTSCAMVSFDITNGGFAQVGRTHWDGNFDFPSATRHVLATTAGNAYFAAHQWRASALDVVTGGTNEDILAEDDAGTLAIGTRHAWDVALASVTVAHANPVSAAAFAAAGQEAWMYSASGLDYVAASELQGAHPLGGRELPPAPLATYTIEQLIHDPTHGVLYARDSARNAIVVIDATTLQPTRELRVGPLPSDMALDPSGAALYVGHADMEAIARLDLTAMTFDRFVQTPRLPYEIEPAGAGRVIVASRYNSSVPTLVLVATGQAAPTTHLVNAAALGVTADGTTLFAGETGSSGCDVFKFTIGSSNLALITRTTNLPFNGPPRRIVPHPTGSSVYFATSSLDGTNLSTTRYATPEPILSVSPDGRVALSASSVIDVATGTTLGPLPVSSTVQAVNANSHTAYLWTASAIMPVSLDAYVP